MSAFPLPAQQTKDDHSDIASAVAFVEKVYNRYRAPDSLSWEEIKPYVEKHVRHLYSSTEKVV